MASIGAVIDHVLDVAVTQYLSSWHGNLSGNTRTMLVSETVLERPDIAPSKT